MCSNGNPLDPINNLVSAAVSGVGSVLGLTPPSNAAPAPVVIRDAPKADAAKIAAEAAAAASADSLNRRRRIRASSLLATGGQGDPNMPLATTPSATPGKDKLGG